MVEPSTLERHKYLKKCIEALDGADWTWLRKSKVSELHRGHQPQKQKHNHPQHADNQRATASSEQGVGLGIVHEMQSPDEAAKLNRHVQHILKASSAIQLINPDNLVLETHNSGERLVSGHPNNFCFELHDQSLADILDGLHRATTQDPATVELRARAIQWAQTLRSYLASLLDAAIVRTRVSTMEAASHLYSRNTDRFHDRKVRASPLVLACLAVLSALFLFLNIGRLQANLVARLLEGVVNTAFDQVRSEQGSAPPRFSLGTYNITTAVDVLGVEPEIISYVCCPRPNCCALYKPAVDGSFPELCTASVRGVECGYKLSTTCTSFNGHQYSKPHRMYHKQSIMTALGKILSRPGIEDFIQQYADEISAPQLLPGLRDLWHGSALSQGLLWKQKGEPNDEKRELRIVFSLSIDWFNAHHSSQRGKSWSVGAVYLTILNLPPHLRHLSENMILVGLIPGPQKPTETAVQSFLDDLVDELLALWDHGVYLTRTSKYRVGRLVRAALGPLVCDLDAVRPILGIGGHSHSRPCSVCWITKQQVQERDVSMNWRRRTLSEHRQLASFYSKLDDPTLEDNHWKEHGVRPSALYRLGYWDPLVWTVIDPMHNWLLGVLSHHLTDIFGLKPKAKGRRLPIDNYDPVVNPGDGAYAFCVLRNPRVTESQLSKLGLQTLKNLAGRLSINPDRKTKKQLIEEFMSWKERQTRTSELSEEELELVANWLKRSVDWSKWARTVGRDDLRMVLLHVAPPEVLINHIRIHGDSKSLVEALKHVLIPGEKLSPVPPMGDRQKFSRPPLGADELREIREDRDATIFPSWIPKGPADFGAAAHGALSANEARTAGLYHVPLTLIRLWGSKPNISRERLRLKHLLHLVEATDLATRHWTFPERWLSVGHHSVTYLSLSKRLFPSINGTPNEHLILHQPELLRRFGPARGYWAFTAERFNGVIQKTPSNHIIGNQMELGQLRRLLMGEDFKVALENKIWSGCLSHIEEPLKESILGRYEGNLLTEHNHPWSSRLHVDVASTTRPLLPVNGRWLAALRAATGTTRPWFHIKALRWESAQFTAHPWLWNGHPHKQSRNSLVLISVNRTPRPAVIRCIASPSASDLRMTSVQLIVQCFKPLPEIDSRADPFQFNRVANLDASLFHRFYTCAACLEVPMVIEATSLVCHVGYTPYKSFSVPAAVITVLNRD